MKRITRSILVASAILIALSFRQASACTTFCLKNKGEVLFGKNYDWMVGEGLVFVNKRNVVKESLNNGSPKPAKWVSKYGSVTFNQYGWENPSGGMNEAGLVIELMWLDGTQYTPDDVPTIDVLEWIQFHLDTSATVAELIKNSSQVRIDSAVKLHYLVNDREGNSATIEFLKGALVVHQGDTLPVSTLTNNTYAESLSYSKTTPIEKARGNGSLERFARAAQKTGDFTKAERKEADAVSYAFEILSDVAQKGYTQWSIVYDQKRHKIHFRTLQSPQVKTIDAKAFDYSCGTTVKIFDMNAKASGDVTAKFTDYTRQANRNLIERAFNGTDFLKFVPGTIRDGLAAYPEQFTCSVPQSKPAAATMSGWRKTALAFVPTLIILFM